MKAREKTQSSRWPAAMRFATAAEYLDCSESEVRDLVNADKLTTIQYDKRGHRRISKDVLDAFIRAREDEPVTT